MSKLPVISGKDLVKALTKQGYYIRGQTGSHIHLRHHVKPAITIPNHPTISRGTLNAIIKQLGMTREEFIEMLA
ncbi:MAG TPA: type II toxin-antitoxin system HicA family toxin [archaeon]|nr:type II toxin-antitoxin system HicA family toxin [archaeon]